MPASGWLRWTLAVAMVAVALYHLSRLAMARSRWSRPRQTLQVGAPMRVDVELTHAAMGSAMTVMVLDSVGRAGFRSLGVVFVASTLWFASRAVHTLATDGPRSADVLARQVIGCAAMAYMLLVLAVPAGAGTMTGAMHGMSMAGAGGSVVNLLSAPVFRLTAAGATVAMAAWTIVRTRVRSVNAGPALSLGCQLAVSATTVYMLAAM